MKKCHRFTVAIDNKDYCISPCGSGGSRTECKGNKKLCSEVKKWIQPGK